MRAVEGRDLGIVFVLSLVSDLEEDLFKGGHVDTKRPDTERIEGGFKHLEEVTKGLGTIVLELEVDLEGTLRVKAGLVPKEIAQKSAERSNVVEAVLLHETQVVAHSKRLLEFQRRADASHSSLGHDGNTISQKICLFLYRFALLIRNLCWKKKKKG